MATQKPLVIIGGQVQQIPTGDTLEGSTGWPAFYEPVIVDPSNFVFDSAGELVLTFGG